MGQKIDRFEWPFQAQYVRPREQFYRCDSHDFLTCTEVASARLSSVIEATVYVIICVLTGILGKRRRMGFLGTFVFALVVTPLIVLPVLLLTGPSHRFRWHPRE